MSRLKHIVYGGGGGNGINVLQRTGGALPAECLSVFVQSESQLSERTHTLLTVAIHRGRGTLMGITSLNHKNKNKNFVQYIVVECCFLYTPSL